MSTVKNIKIVLVLLVLSCLGIPGQSGAITVAPKEIAVNTTFNGQDVYVTGELPADEEIVVQLVGKSAESEFKQQGKVGGVLWMTVGHLSIANLPSAYMVYLPETISNWRDANNANWTGLQLSYASLASEMEISPEPEDREGVFQNFLKLKESDGLYQMVENGVEYNTRADGIKEFTASVHIPAKMPLDTFALHVLRVKDGKVVDNDTSEVTMKQVGFPALVSDLAFKHGLLYGVLAVGFAIVAGLFMGLLFRDKGGAH